MGKEKRPIGCVWDGDNQCWILRERQGNCIEKGERSIHICIREVGELQAALDAKQILGSRKAYDDAISSGRYHTSAWYAHASGRYK